MARQKKTPHPFDRHLGTVIRATRTRRGMTQAALAEAAHLPLSNLQRREDGRNETTVSELERIADALSVTTREIVDMALTDYSDGRGAQDGLQKLMASMSEAERTVTDEDNVTYLPDFRPTEAMAANEEDRLGPKDD